MSGKSAYNWANDFLIAETINDRVNNTLGVLANLILLESKENDPNIKLIRDWYSKSEKISDLMLNQPFFSTKESAEKFIDGLNKEYKELVKKQKYYSANSFEHAIIK